MPMNAIAIVRVAPEAVLEALPEGGEGGARVGACGEPVRIRALSDATLVHLGVPLTEPPLALGRRLAALLGDVLAAHHEPRGVPLFPDTYELAASSWDEAVAELGDGAEWIRLEAPGPGFPDLSSLLGEGGATGLEALAQQLRGGDPEALLGQALEMARELAESGALAGLAAQLGEGAGAPEEALARMGVGPGVLDAMGVDVGALAEQARSILDGTPGLARELEARLGAPPSTRAHDEEE